MRLNLKLSVLGCALAGVIASSLPAAADWHKPYIYRESNGSWTNVRYDDGVCNYYFSRNSYDNNMHLNKYGDCSHVVIGPDGMARPVYMTPAPYGAPMPYGGVETYGSGLE
jgi:hypothetical protein